MAESPKTKRLRIWRDKLHQRRSNFLQTWQSVAESVLPNRANFTTQQVEGAPRTAYRFDSTGMLAQRDLKNALGAMIMPHDHKWLFVRPQDYRLIDDDAALLWCEMCENAMLRALYDKDAQFMRYSGEIDDDLTAFGQGHLYEALNASGTGLHFRSWHLKDAVFSENKDGVIDTIFLDRYLTAEQARSLQPDTGKLPREIRDELNKADGPDPSKTWRFTFCIYPNEEHRDELNDDYASRFGKFSECVICDKHDDVIRESGYPEFPVATPRWDTESEEYNARSPAMLALGDMLSSQQIGKTILKAGHMSVEPPILAPHNAVVNRVNLYPGGITYYVADRTSQYGTRAPIGPLVNDFKLPYGRDIQKDVRDQIWLAFYRNVLHLPVDGPQMTAFEVAQRRQEFMRALGPVFSRVESDYPAHIAVRTFNLMRRAGAFPPPPDSLRRSGIQFDFLSPLHKVLEERKLDAYRAWLQDMAPLGEQMPHIFDHVDEDVLSREAAKIRGIPMSWMRPKDDVQAIRERRDQMAQQEQQKQDIERGAGTAVNVAKTIDLASRREQQQQARAA